MRVFWLMLLNSAPLTCPKKATLKYVPSSLLPVCITSITLV